MNRDELLNEIGRRLSSEVPAQSRVVLFGSRARGDAAVDSDLDLLIIEPAVDDPVRESVRLRRALRGLRVPVDVVVVNRQEADSRARVRGTLIERAFRDGRVLVDG